MIELDVVIVEVDDWAACYINNELKFEAHSVRYDIIFRDYLIGNFIKSFNRKFLDINLEECYNCCFPVNLKDLKEYE